MLGVARMRVDRSVAMATLDEAVQVAREAAVPSALSVNLSVTAGFLPIEEADRALAMLDEAIELGARIGDLMGVALATKNKGWIAARRGDWMLALQAAVDTSEQNLQLGNAIDLYTTFHLAGAAFCALGSFAPAAVLIAAGDSSRDRDHTEGLSSSSRPQKRSSWKSWVRNSSRNSGLAAHRSIRGKPWPSSAPRPSRCSTGIDRSEPDRPRRRTAQEPTVATSAPGIR